MHDIKSPAPVTDETIEAEIQRKKLEAPRVKPADLEDAIVDETYHVFPNSQLTVCVLTLRNGFNVTGESACASPANFDADIGQRVARENAKQKLWPLLGYALKESLAKFAASFQDRVRNEKAELDAKLHKLQDFLVSSIFTTLPDDERVRLQRQAHWMEGYSDILTERISAF
jgi:hypothetical protein